MLDAENASFAGNTMQFRAEDYYRASQERMRQAWENYKTGDNFALAMYCGGLAVESLLRAFRWEEDSSFEGRHNLMDLLKASRLLTIDDGYMRVRGASEDEILQSSRRIMGAVNEVVALWHNNLRFASESRLKAHLRQIGRLKGTKGDPLKKNTRDLLEAAQIRIERGGSLWISRKRSKKP